MRAAVLADIHGNLPALDAVLGDIDAVGVDAIVLNGDIATGPMPAETLDRLAGLGEKAIWVRGNADRELVAAYDGVLNPDLPDAARAPTEYCASRLDLRHRDLLANLPLSITMDLAGLGSVRFCHATTRSDTVLVDSPIETETALPTLTSQLSYSVTPTCRLTGSPIADGSSILGASGCPTAIAAGFGRCLAPASYCAAPTTTRMQLLNCSAPRHRNIPDWRNSSKRTC